MAEEMQRLENKVFCMTTLIGTKSTIVSPVFIVRGETWRAVVYFTSDPRLMGGLSIDFIDEFKGSRLAGICSLKNILLLMIQ